MGKWHSCCLPEYSDERHVAQSLLMVASGSLHPLSAISSFYSYAFLFLTYSALGVALLIK